MTRGFNLKSKKRKWLFSFLGKQDYDDYDDSAKAKSTPVIHRSGLRTFDFSRIFGLERLNPLRVSRKGLCNLLNAAFPGEGRR